MKSVRSTKRFIALLAAVAASAIVLPTAASAAPPVRNQATVLSHVTIDNRDPSVGYVKAQYTCQPGPDVPHLWVSVKQNASATADPALTTEGSGFGHVSTTWVQSHPVNVRCDGKNHVQDFRVDTTEVIPDEFGGGTVGYGALKRGQGYVQFCLFAGDGAFIFDMQFQSVK